MAEGGLFHQTFQLLEVNAHPEAGAVPVHLNKHTLTVHSAFTGLGWMLGPVDAAGGHLPAYCTVPAVCPSVCSPGTV